MRTTVVAAALLAASLSPAAGPAGAPPPAAAAATAPSDPAAGAWIRVHGSRAALHELIAIDGQGIDYGRFQWLPRSSVDVTMLGQHPRDWHSSERPFELDLGGRRFDPLDDPPAGRSFLSPAWRPADGPDWRLVQFRGPIRRDWLAGLEQVGLEPVQYIHPFTYVVWGRADALARSGQLPGVRWHGEFAPEFRVAPLFRGAGPEVIELQVIVRAGLSGIVEALRGSGVEIAANGRMDRHLDAILVRAPATGIADLAVLPGVYTVQPVATDGGTRSEMSAQINADNVDADGVVFPGYLDYLDKLGLDGGGVVMACVDDGINDRHPDLAGRLLDCTGPSCGDGTESPIQHGTHVAGIMAGDASSGTVNTGGFLRGQGMAPAAGLINQHSFPRPGADGMLNLMRDSVRNEATISNNSWGPAGSPRGYDVDTRYTDIGVRDADIDAEGDQPLTYVLAIMNGLGGTSTQGTPDEAKNLFTIGSTWAQANANIQDMRHDHISSNSGHGPALDGRFIPHMVAASRFTDSTVGSGGYALQGGTSQAAPHVAGAAALFTQHYRQRFHADPSPALVKAAFIAVARDLEGNNDANSNPIGARPDSKQGWGRMQLAATVAPELPVVYLDQAHVFGDTGQSWQAQYVAADPAQPMRVMLVWTDAPGHGLGGTTPAWNNDLDLRVRAGADLYLGNVFENGWSATGGAADERNNTEGVFLQAGQHGGAIGVEVLAANINSNALPNAGTDNAQDFALVCYNCASVAGEADLGLALADVPDPVSPGGALSYLVQAANFGPDAASGVTVTLTLPDEAVFTGSRTVPLGGGIEWQCGYAGGVVACTLPDVLAANALAPTLAVDTRIAADAAAGTILASARIESDAVDPVPDNDIAVEPTGVLGQDDGIFSDGFECVATAPGC